MNADLVPVVDAIRAAIPDLLVDETCDYGNGLAVAVPSGGVVYLARWVGSHDGNGYWYQARMHDVPVIVDGLRRAMADAAS